MKLQTRLFHLALGTVVLPVALAVGLGFLLVRYEQEAFRRGALDQNRAFMTAVDTEMRRHIGALQALAASRNLEADNLAAFYDDAKRVLKTQRDWRAIILLTPDGPVVNTSYPYGTKLPPTAEKDSVHEVFSRGAPVIGNITKGRADGAYGIPVRIPILRAGKTVYALTAVVEPAAFQRLMQAHGLPSNWITGLVDARGHFVARIPPRSPEQTASPAFMGAIAKEREGWYRGLTVEGKDTYTAHKTSTFSGWSVGLAIPAAEVSAAAVRAAWLVALGALLTLTLAVLYAYWMGRRISDPIISLAAAAGSLGDNQQAPADRKFSIQEVEKVREALVEASAAIRERHRLLEREQALLKAADQAKDEFLAMLAHELRNPLSAISNAAALLEQRDLPAVSRKAAESIILRQTDQLTHLVNDLLDVGRVVAGKIHLEQEPVDLCDVAQAAASAVNAMERTTHRIKVETAGSIGVMGDRARLEQVVSNLLSNAIAHTPPDGSVAVSTAVEDGQAVLRVTDTGSGIKEDELRAIFDLFYQSNRALHGKGGLGIGLTVVKRIVALHGGSVEASSAGPGKGATFTIRLPLYAGEIPESPKRPDTAPSPLKILVIDDSADARDSLKLLLEASGGHEVHVAGDGPSGIAQALAERPAIAFVDIGMPGMDGYQVASELRRKLDATIKLAALTGYGQPADVKRALEAGFDFHLVKPADLDALNDVLKSLNR